MSTKKCHQYNSPCPLAKALDLLGDHWTLLIVRDLMFMEKHEFKELLESWEGISTNILSNRLVKLSEADIIDSIPHPESKKRKLYYLTESGKDLFAVIAEITIWGHRQDGSEQIPPHLKELLTGSKAKVERVVRKSLQKWEQFYLD